MNTFNKFTFTKEDGNSTLVLELEEDVCTSVVSEFVSFMRGCGFVDVNIYSAMAELADEYFITLENIKSSEERDVLEAMTK